MLKLRLRGLELCRRKPMPTWGSDLSGIDFENIKDFVRSTEKQAARRDDLPADIKKPYDRQGPPGAQEQRLHAPVDPQPQPEAPHHTPPDDRDERRGRR